jgi:sugar phosphate isomerase/epimerase
LRRRPLGVCTWTFGDRPLAEIAERIAALGYDGLELAGDLSRYSAAEARRVAADSGLRIFSLTPANVDPAHPDPAVAQPAIEYFLHLVEFAAELGEPLISYHGFVGRVRPVAEHAAEERLLVEALRQVGAAAAGLGLRLTLEVLNRYESHLANTATDGLRLIEATELDNVGLLLDAYHMNIEEPDPAAALLAAGPRLWLYHVADSNRQGIGRGHTRFGEQMAALDEIGYGGPIIVECTAPGPDPFTPIKDQGSLAWLERYLAETRQWLDHS